MAPNGEGHQSPSATLLSRLDFLRIFKSHTLFFDSLMVPTKVSALTPHICYNNVMQ